MTGQEEKLDEILKRIYHPDDIELVKKNMSENASANTKDVGFKEALFSPKYRRASWTGFMLTFFQQFTGVNCLMVYSYPIYEETEAIDPAVGSLILQGLNVLITIIAAFLLQKVGRRTLLVQG